MAELRLGPDRDGLAPAGDGAGGVRLRAGLPHPRRAARRARLVRRRRHEPRATAHEALNFAGVRRLPVVFVDRQQPVRVLDAELTWSSRREHIADRAAGYGFEGVVVDGTDVLAVHREARAAIEKARAGDGPTLLELVTLRSEGHAVHDDAFYVPRGAARRMGAAPTRSSATVPG